MQLIFLGGLSHSNSNQDTPPYLEKAPNRALAVPEKYVWLDRDKESISFSFPTQCCFLIIFFLPSVFMQFFFISLLFNQVIVIKRNKTYFGGSGEMLMQRTNLATKDQSLCSKFHSSYQSTIANSHFFFF